MARQNHRTGPVTRSPIDARYVPPVAAPPPGGDPNHDWNPPYDGPIAGGPDTGTDPANQPGDTYQRRDGYNEFGAQTGLEGDVNFRMNLGIDPGLMDYGSRVAGSPHGSVDYQDQAVASRARAHTREAQENEMSAYHLEQMLASDSPLMRRARAKAAAGSSGRGLMNSSIAQGAAMGAMIDRAQPFALQDATAHQRAATESLAAKNQAELTNAELGTRASIAGMQANASRDQLLMQADISGNQDVLRHLLGMETREDQQRWQEIENAAQRDWQTKEREGGQEFQNQQREFQNIWQSEENKQRAIERWAELNLQRASNRETALAQTLAQIYSNPNLTAKEQQAAAERAKEILRSTYGAGDDSLISEPPWASRGNEEPPAPGTSTEPQATSENYKLNTATGQVVISPSNPSAEKVTATLPPIL